MEPLSAKILGQIAIIQSTLSAMPDNENMLEFVCRGLEDIPGVVSVNYCLYKNGADTQRSSDKNYSSQHKFIIKLKEHELSELLFKLSDPASFSPYIPFIENLSNMLAVLIEDRQHRRLNESLVTNLESRVNERTYELSKANEALKTDIRMRMQAEKALIDSERKNRAWLEKSVVCTKILDLDFNLQYMSAAGVQALNIDDITSLYGKPYPFDFYPESFKTTMTGNLKKALETNEVIEQEAPVVDVDGNELWFHSTIIPVKDEEGKNDYMMVLSLETTGRKQAEEELQKLSRAVEASSSTVIITDKNANIEYVNPKFTELTGYTKEEVIGKNPRLLKSGETPKENYVAMWEALSSGKEWKLITHNRKKDGTLYWDHCSISGIKNSKGEITHYVSIQDDVTRQKQMEEQLVQAQKMEALGHLTGGIAHDFNNILTPVLGYAYMMKESIDRQNYDKLDNYLDYIISGASRAQKLVKDMLLFGRKGLVATKPISVNTVVHNTASLMKGSLPSSIEISIKLDNNLPSIVIDPIQIEQMIMNLSINGRDAMNEVGELAIGTQLLTIAEDNNKFPDYLLGDTCERMDICFCQKDDTPIHVGDYVELTVRDTGTGMSKEILTRIFEPFFTDKDVGKGTGMGLAMVHGIMENAKGHIIVETKADKGTLFRLLFQTSNITGAIDSPATADKVATSSIENLSVLVVDDDIAVLDYLKDLLSKHGCDVETYVNSEDALAQFQETPEKFDMVITDQTMPKLTGAELSKKLLTIRPDIPIILCSGYSELINETQAKIIGISEYLPKPIDPKQVLKVIKEIIPEVA